MDSDLAVQKKNTSVLMEEEREGGKDEVDSVPQLFIAQSEEMDVENDEFGEISSGSSDTMDTDDDSINKSSIYKYQSSIFKRFFSKHYV